MLEKVKREYRRRPPEAERAATQSSSSSSQSSRQQSTQERPYNRRDDDHQHRSALPSRAMEGYNLSAEVRRPLERQAIVGRVYLKTKGAELSRAGCVAGDAG